MKFLQKDPLTGITYSYKLINKNKSFELSRNGKLIAQFDENGKASDLEIDRSTFLLIDDLVANLIATKIKEGKV